MRGSFSNVRANIPGMRCECYHAHWVLCFNRYLSTSNDLVIDLILLIDLSLKGAPTLEHYEWTSNISSSKTANLVGGMNE